MMGKQTYNPLKNNEYSQLLFSTPGAALEGRRSLRLCSATRFSLFIYYQIIRNCDTDEGESHAR
jgi:hypothetical protein